MAPLTLVHEGFPTTPGLDTAVGRAMLLRASDGELGETFRIHRPGRVVAFGKHDALAPGYERAVDAAAGAGFLPIARLAGGRAAVFHEHTLAFHWTVPDPDPTSGITERFEKLAGWMAAAFRRLGADARIGEVAGEYCPGAYSVNVFGTHKVMGVGQRLARRAAHVGGVIVVDDVALTNRPLVPVYDALGIDWRPQATGALSLAVPGVEMSDVVDALVSELARSGEIAEGRVDGATLQLARSLVDEHLPRPVASPG